VRRASRTCFRSRLDQIIDLRHPLVKLSREIDWAFLEQTFGEACRDGPGQPPLPTRLMAGLMILKYTHDLSDEALCERWVENPYYQYFCGEEFFLHELVLDRSSLSNWRKRMGEEKVKALLQESLAVAVKTGAVRPSHLSEVIVDTTVQPKNVMFPTDARLLNRAREILVRLAKTHGVKLRQSYARVGKFALIKHQRYAHAKQFKRANRALNEIRPLHFEVKGEEFLHFHDYPHGVFWDDRTVGLRQWVYVDNQDIQDRLARGLRVEVELHRDVRLGRMEEPD
jgi:transposase, IS5 family